MSGHLARSCARLAISLTLAAGAVVAVAAAATPAEAASCGAYTSPICPSPQGYHWRIYDGVGSCADTNGHYVREWQLILFVGGNLSSTDVDGLWGPTTLSATKTWQARQGLTNDGCVGYNTWSKAQFGSDLYCITASNCTSYPHMIYDGQVPTAQNTTGQQWTYEQPKYTTRTRDFTLDGATPFWDGSDTRPGWWWLPSYTLGSNSGPCVHQGTETCVVS